MLSLSRPCLPRSAVAFFNMKHFQVKHKVVLTPQTVYSSFASCLSPRDRLLRQSKSGKGAGRVLVLDTSQRVKGMYIPVTTLPHPATVKGGDSSLGITVEDYLKLIEPSATTQSGAPPAAAPPAPSTVLAVVSHPQGLGFGVFNSDGSSVFPLVNTNLSAADSAAVGGEKYTEESRFGQTAQLSRSLHARLPAMEHFQRLLGEHKAAVDACATLYWITRDENDSLTLRTMRACEVQAAEADLIPEGGDKEQAGSLRPSGSPYAVSFADPRWISVQDIFFNINNSSQLYSRDSKTMQRTVDEEGLRGALTSGFLMLDYVPRSAVKGSDAGAKDPAKL